MKKILNFIFILILVIFPLGQLLRLQFPSFPEIKFQAFDFLIFIFVFSWLINKISRKEKFVPPQFFKLMSIFAAIAVFSFLIKAPTIPLPSLYPSFLYLIRFLVYFLSFWSFYDFQEKNKLPINTYLIVEGVIIAIFALAQYFVIPDTRFIYNLGWDEHYFRAIGTFLDPAFTSLLLILSFIVWLTGSFSSGKKKVCWWLSGLLILLGIGLSFSRASYLITLISAAIIFLVRKKIMLFLAFSTLFVCLIIFLPKPAGEGVNLLRTNSITSKFKNYRESFEIIKGNNLFGVGFNNYRITQKLYGFLSEENWQSSNAGAGADNSFLFIWATTGILGLISFLFLIGKILRRSFKLMFKSETALILFVSLISICLSSLFVNALFYPWVLFWEVLLLAKFTVEN